MKIEIKDWDHTCGDGCCYTWGVDIKLEDGRSVSVMHVGANETRCILDEILPLFGIQPEIELKEEEL